MAKHKAPRPDIGRRLAQLMADTEGLRTQMALSKRSGVGQTTIGRILRGEVNPSVGVVEKLAAALGSSAEYLLSGGITVTRQWPTVRQDGRLPYLDADQILPFIRGEKPEIHDWMACPREDLGQRAFVTVVQGVAMSPQVEDGAFVFVDPDQSIKTGTLVLVLTPRPVVRQLVMEGDTQLLAVTGRDWPGPKLEPMSNDAVIAGPVIGKWVPTPTQRGK